MRRRSHRRSSGFRFRQVREARSRESGLLLGHLTALVIITPSGKELSASQRDLKGWFVAWVPTASKDFLFVREAKGQPTGVSPQVIKTFKQFHNTAPKRATVWRRPDPVGGLRQIGVIKSLTYVIPRWMDSPKKAGYQWVHAFGDHGESGHGPIDGRGEKVYPRHLMPAIYQDRAGNIYVKRRPGNKYDVTEWIYW